MQSVVRKLVQAPLVRTLATTAPKKDVPAQYLKIKEKQKWFNVDNGKRVHEVRVPCCILSVGHVNV